VSASSPVRLACAVAVAVVLVACGGPNASRTPPAVSPSATPAVTPSSTPGVGDVVPAPGSSSTVYAPNPGAIVVAIDPGHGGCLDWGVPNPWDNTVESAEKSDTLAIGLALRDLLVAQGIEVVMTRTDDSALAGDYQPDFGCNGPPWRDVDGNGQAGFDETGHTRTRDELQARIDLANLSRADALISIHINSLTANGEPVPVAATETYYDDETPWGTSASSGLAQSVQGGVMAALGGVASYQRQDRGIAAVAYYLISRQWQDGDTCETSGDVWCRPHRGIQLPSVLTEVGSITFEAESQLLAGQAGRAAAAQGIFDGLVGYFAARPLAARYDALLPGGEAGVAPVAVPGAGPPFWAPVLPDGGAAATLALRLTNVGSESWPAGLTLAVGWSATDGPYLSTAPDGLESSDARVPALAPGESVVVQVPLDPPAGTARQIAWLTLVGPDGPLTASGVPALQLATQAAG
jgi:N-acetylmuramoyl-L-alanine amidase